MRSVTYHSYTIYEDGRIFNRYGNRIKHQKKRDGRLEVRLVVDNKRVNYVSARLIYFVFNPFNIEDKNLCVTFKDGDKTKIHVDNLILVHRKDLIQGDKHKNRATITDEEAEAIRKEYKGQAGENQHDKKSPSLRDLAIKYGTTKDNIKQIVKGMSRNKDNYKLK